MNYQKLAAKTEQARIERVEAIWEAYYDRKLTMQEIADAYGITRGRVWQILHARRKQLEDPRRNHE